MTMKRNIANYIDHTNLKPDAAKKDIARLCREAKKYGFASVCVNPCRVEQCAKLLKGSKVKVCAVIGFPLGASDTAVKLFEAASAIANGAEELDLVVNQAWLKEGSPALATELALFVKSSRDFGRENKRKVVLKLILECCNLTEDEIVAGCKAAVAAGFDFVKTSTGFAKGGATVEDVALMRKTVGRKCGVKAAGGIRDRATALAMIAAGANRLGTSSGPKLVVSASGS